MCPSGVDAVPAATPTAPSTAPDAITSAATSAAAATAAAPVVVAAAPRRLAPSTPPPPPQPPCHAVADGGLRRPPVVCTALECDRAAAVVDDSGRRGVPDQTRPETGLRRGGSGGRSGTGREEKKALAAALRDLRVVLSHKDVSPDPNTMRGGLVSAAHKQSHEKFRPPPQRRLPATILRRLNARSNTWRHNRAVRIRHRARGKA